MVLGREVEPRIGDFTPDLWMTNHETTIVIEERDTNILQPYAPRMLREVG